MNSKEEFIEAVKQSGLVGLGGAGFPAHIKLNPKDKIEYLCINAAECEPYITADVREIMENHENVLYGISQVRKTGSLFGSTLFECCSMSVSTRL